VLPIDTTGSMGGVINDVKANVAQLIATLRTGGGIVRVEIVAYRDTGDEYVVRSFPLRTIDAARAPNTRARAGRLCAIGVSRHDRMAVIRRIRRHSLSARQNGWRPTRSTRPILGSCLGTKHRDGRGTYHIGGRVRRG
jgi:hypothetical protein